MGLQEPTGLLAITPTCPRPVPAALTRHSWRASHRHPVLQMRRYAPLELVRTFSRLTTPGRRGRAADPVRHSRSTCRPGRRPSRSNDADGQPAAAVASALERTTSATGELTRDEILETPRRSATNTGVSASVSIGQTRAVLPTPRASRSPPPSPSFRRAVSGAVELDREGDGNPIDFWDEVEKGGVDLRRLGDHSCSPRRSAAFRSPSLGTRNGPAEACLLPRDARAKVRRIPRRRGRSERRGEPSGRRRQLAELACRWRGRDRGRAEPRRRDRSRSIKVLSQASVRPPLAQASTRAASLTSAPRVVTSGKRPAGEMLPT